MDYILEGATQEDINHAEKELLRYNAPRNYYGAKGEEVKFIEGYESVFIKLGQHVHKDPKYMTVLEYYKALEIVDKQLGNG